MYLSWLLHILIILGPYIWKQLLKEIIKLQYILVGLVTTFANEHTRSKNMEATFKGNHTTLVNTSCDGYYMYLTYLVKKIWNRLLKEIIKLYFTSLPMVTKCTEHTRSRNIDAIFKESHRTLVNPICNGYYMYWTY